MVEQLLRFQVVLMDNVIVELMLRAETVTNAIVVLLVQMPVILQVKETTYTKLALMIYLDIKLFFLCSDKGVFNKVHIF